MALIYLAAFWSLGVQILGLVGSHGILPASDFLNYIHQAGRQQPFLGSSHPLLVQSQ